MSNDQRTRTEKRFRRLLGQSPEKREELKAVLDEAPDWWGTCRKCGKKVQGTPAEIAAHRCE
jgi:hypothetical protein